MSIDQKYQELLIKYELVNSKVGKIEKENASLIALNEIFKEELQQKTLALQKSNHDYELLKSQYEELLMLITELHTENQKNQSPEQSPLSSPNEKSGDNIVNSLKKQIDQITERKNEYKKHNKMLNQKISNLEKKLASSPTSETMRNWNQAYDNILEIVSPIVQIDPNGMKPWEYLVYSAKKLVEKSQHSEDHMKYLKMREKLKKVLGRCKKMTNDVENNNRIIDQMVQKNIPLSSEEILKNEIGKMENFLLQYEKKSKVIDSE